MIKGTCRAVAVFILMNICLGLAVTCPAYVLSPEFILEKMTAALGRTSGYVVSQQISLDDSACDALTDNAGVFEETDWLKPTGKFRSKTMAHNLKREYVFDYDRALTIVDRQIISIEENPLMVYKDLLVFRDRGSLGERLSALGIDMSVVSLGRFGDSVAFVIGAKYPDESVSQLWVDRETFLPLRLLLKKRTGDFPVEVRYLDWRKEYRFFHPYRIEIYQDGRISRVICVKDVQNGCQEPGGFFDVAALQSKYPTLKSGREFETQPEEQNRPVQQTIDDFTKLYQ